MLTIIKLNNGTEVIGFVEKTHGDNVTIRDPMQINYRLTSIQPTPLVSVSRYMPFSESNIFVFNKHDIMHQVKPRKAMADYYTHAVHIHTTNIDLIIDKELKNAILSASTDELSSHYKKLLEHFDGGGVSN